MRPTELQSQTSTAAPLPADDGLADLPPAAHEEGALPEESPVRSRALIARRILIAGVLLGVSADMLLRDAPWGIGLACWVILLVAEVTALAWRRGDSLSREQLFWMTSALFTASVFAWRDAEFLLFWNFVATVFAIAMLGSTLAGGPVLGIATAGILDVVRAVLRGAGDFIASVVPLTLRDAMLGAIPGGMRGRAGTVLRSAAITLPLLLVFGTLLGSADPVFASLFDLPEMRIDVVLSHVVLTGFFAWGTAGWMRGALLEQRTPTGTAVRAPIFTLGRAELTSALGALAGLFALFVVVQLRWLFGGEAVVRATTGLGYAEYARRGFFELAWVSALMLPVLLGANATLPLGDANTAARFRLLARVLVGLVGAIMVSAFGRMNLYVHYYGLTPDRLYASVAIGWLAVVFGWLTLTVLRGQPRRFAAGLVLSGLGTLAVLDVANPEAIVARANVDRAQRATAGTLARGTEHDDVDYAALWLDADAVPTVVTALLAPPRTAAGMPARKEEVQARCSATRALFNKWSENAFFERHQRLETWTQWNAARSRARREVARTERALKQRVTCWDETRGEVPFRWRDPRPATSSTIGTPLTPAVTPTVPATP